MVAINAFTIVSEFKFEIASALLGTEALTGKVNQLSAAADNAIGRVQSLGIQLASSLGVGSALSIASNAISASEKFDDAARSFATLILANSEKMELGIRGAGDEIDVLGAKAKNLNIKDLDLRIGIGEEIVKDIARAADKFALDETALLNQSKLLAAQLTAKGLAGTNFDVAIDISRSLLKTAPALNLVPGQIEGQLLRLLEGGASKGDTLFRRLAADTKAFSKFAGPKGSKEFNALKVAERVDILRRGLGQFSDDVDAVDDRVNSLSGQMVRLNNLLTGLNSVLIPLGNTLKKPLVKIMKGINDTLNNQGRAIVRNFSGILEPIIRDPEVLLTNILQLRAAAADLGRVAKAFAVGGIFGTIGFILNKITGVAKFLHPAISLVGVGLAGLFDILGRILGRISQTVFWFFKIASVLTIILVIAAKLFTLKKTLAFLAFSFKAIVIPAVLLFGVFQLISRAIAIAQVNDAKKLPGMAARFSEAVLRIETAALAIAQPFFDMFDMFARLIAPFFSITITGNLLIDSMNILAGILEVIVFQMAIASAWMGVFMETILNGGQIVFNFRMQIVSLLEVLGQFAANPVAFAKDLVTGEGKFGLEGVTRAPDLLEGTHNLFDTFDEGFNDFLTRAGFGAGGPGERRAVVQRTTNIGTQKIDIKNNFKEIQEPDRIAFTIKDQLMKIAQNPVQSGGRSFTRGLNSPLAGSAEP